uniref:Rho GDP-dissociation inhibitor 1 n=1 Tax=Musa acuminata subsp. malaccensis TaxID=214687 RepID=A0A804JQ92_MUSAM|nr:PREDICTED: rho GDP-dissociation inhibitor 1 isoform X2 [Musa acuminata subsp. malaccensis]
MEKGGQRVEAESSSASAGVVVVVQESSDAVGEETEVELGGRDVEDEEVDADEDEEAGADGFVPSPLIPLKDQLEKDKEDESLRRWKEKLLGCVEGELDGVVSEGHVDSVTSLPVAEMQNRVLFTLKEGSKYRLKLTFSVRHNIVSGLTYSNTVWKRGLKVDQNKGMLGAFAPQRDPHELLLEEETTPFGVLARGIYSAKLKFEDDDKRCYLELDYSFEIKKR